MFADATGVICNRESKDRQYKVKKKKARKDKQATTIGYLILLFLYFFVPLVSFPQKTFILFGFQTFRY